MVWTDYSAILCNTFWPWIPTYAIRIPLPPILQTIINYYRRHFHARLLFVIVEIESRIRSFSSKFHVSSVINNSASSISRVNINFFSRISSYKQFFFIRFCKFFFSKREKEKTMLEIFFEKYRSGKREISKYSFIWRPERIKEKKDAIEEHLFGEGKKKKIQRKLHKPRLKYPSIILIWLAERWCVTRIQLL